MPSMVHEAVVELFRNRPDVATLLLRPLGIDVPTTLTVGSADLGQVVPVEYRADLVLEAPEVAVIVEVQRRVDARKRGTWPVYVATCWAGRGGRVVLLVVTLDEAVAAWARQPILVGHPDFCLRPLVVGPSAIPKVLSPEVARACPELAVLAAMVHGAGSEGEEIARSAILAVEVLDRERARLYSDLVLASLNAAARKILEVYMIPNYEWQSDYFRDMIKKVKEELEAEWKAEATNEGRKEGRKEGHREGLQAALLLILQRRNFTISPAVASQIVACEDPDLLQRWLNRAITAYDVDAVFEPLEEPVDG